MKTTNLTKVPNWQSSDRRLVIIYDFHPQDPERKHTQYFYDGKPVEFLGWPCKNRQEASERSLLALTWYNLGFISNIQGTGSITNLIRISDKKFFQFFPAAKHNNCGFICETERQQIENGHEACYRVVKKVATKDDGVKWMLHYEKRKIKKSLFRPSVFRPPNGTERRIYDW